MSYEDEAKRVAWEEFWPKLDAVQTLDDAKALSRQTPPPDTPARPYYSNLNTFLASLYPPDGANVDELGVYQRFVENSKLKAEVKEETLARLKVAIQKKSPR